MRNRAIKGWLAALAALWLAFAAATVILLVYPAPAPTAATETHVVGAAEGWYAEEQLAQAAEAYDRHCARCHGAALDGQPPLRGGAFLQRWGGESVHALYQYTRNTMPLDNPGSLDDDTYADTIVHILHVNGFPAGEAPLTAEDQERMRALVIDASVARAREDAVQAPETAREPGEEPAPPEAEDEPEEAEAAAEEEPEAEEAEAEEVVEEEAREEAEAEEVDETEETEETEEAGAEEEEAQEEAEAEEATDEAEDAEAEEVEEEAEEQPEPEVEEEAEDEEEEEPAEPAAGRGWLEVETNPVNVTVNVVGPDGYTERFTGAQTLRDLAPGRYLVAISRGHQSANASVLVEAGETARVSLVLDELSRSEDVPEEPAVPAAEVPAIPGEPADAELEEEAEAAEPETAEEAESEEAEAEEAEAEEAPEEEAQEEAEAEEPAAEGWFTSEQAERGQEAYAQHCAQCHGQDLQGNPPLVGEDFLARWDTVGDLFDYNRTQMPLDNPGSLDDDTYADITAHILQVNDFPAGEEELPADQERLDQLPLDPEEAGETEEAAAEEEAQADQEEAEVEEAEEADEETQEAEEETAEEPQEAAEEGEAEEPEAEEADEAEEESDLIQAERGAEAYAQHCARCHGATLQGDVAPALAGPVFMERWGGHPVDWLHFQARTSMPPHDPGSLDDQVYTDIIVYMLTESGLLEGHEEFGAGDEELLRFVIARGDEQQELREQVEALRQELHEPHEEDVPTAEPLTPDEEPVRPGAPEAPVQEGDEEPEAEEDAAEEPGASEAADLEEQPEEELEEGELEDEGAEEQPTPQVHQEGERLGGPREDR